VLPGALLLIAVLGAAAEAGWPGGGPVERSMPASLPALDGPIAADHSSSIVVDVPFGIRGGLPKRYGAKIEPESLALASSDGHPRAISYTSWIPLPTVRAVRRHAFYARLAAAQTGSPSDSRQASLARADPQRMSVGWVLVWRASPEVLYYLRQTGFRFDYQADGSRCTGRMASGAGRPNASGLSAGSITRPAPAPTASLPAASPRPHRPSPLARQHHPARTGGGALYVNDWFRRCDAG
jgi:hypothetical protein